MTFKNHKSLSALQINATFSLVACILMSSIISVLLYRSLSSSINETTRNYADQQAKQMGLSFKNFLSSHRSILKGYADFPLIRQAAVQPESHIDNAADLMKSFTFLGTKYPLTLLDFEALPLHHTDSKSQLVKDIPEDLNLFLEDDQGFHMDLMTSGNRKYLILGSEINVKDSIEGALLAFIPVNSVLAQNLTDTLEYEIYFKGELISPAINRDNKNFLSTRIDLNKEFQLKTYASLDEVLERQNTVVYSLIMVIVVIFILFSLVSFYLVNKNFLKPLVSLKEMTQSVSKGQDTLPIPQKSSIAELSLLQEDFKRMFTSLNEKTDALNAAKDDLEIKVIERTKELQDKAEELEQLSKYKSEFLARMSHEIRTPMNAIIGYVEILRESQLEKEEQGYLEIINNSADALLTVINDILDFSKIEAGMLHVESTPFNINTILNDIKSMFAKTADEKGLSLEIDKIDPSYQWLNGDPHRIRQIFINLTGNALKFTSRGSVKILIDSKLNGQNIDLSIKIIDTGIGIQENKLDTIFQSFSQAEGSITRNFGGTGLGLPISLSLTELMGGTLTVSSEFEKGSEFCLKLTLPKANPLEQTTIVNKAIQWKEAPEILLVEDNPINQKLALKTLDRLNCKVFTAVNGQEAINKVADQEFDLVLMDCQMPVLDGLEATRQLRTKPENKDLAIIAFTANAMDDEIQECFDAGMNDFITKPFKKNQFVDKLAKWLSHKIADV